MVVELAYHTKARIDSGPAESCVLHRETAIISSRE